MAIVNAKIFLRTKFYNSISPVLLLIALPFILMSGEDDVAIYNINHQIRILLIVSVAFWISLEAKRFGIFTLFNNYINIIIIIIGVLENIFNILGFRSEITIEQNGWRFQGFTNNPNYYSQWLFCSLGFYFISTKLGVIKISKIVYIIYIIGLFMAASRGIFLSFVLSLLLINYGKKISYELSVRNIFFILLIFIPSFIHLGDYYDNVRIDVWSTYLSSILDNNNFMFGHGGGALSKAYQEFEYYPHNSYIMIAFEYGVFGIFLIISYLFLVALRSRAVPLGQFIVLVLALYSIFNDLHMTPHFWFTLGVVATLTKYFTKKINL
jgi:hypothetical protein